MKVDFHTHTIHSDGNDDTKELVKAAKNLDAFSINDHNTIAALPEAVELTNKTGQIFVPGLEISCHIRNPVTNNLITLHVLAHGINPYSEEISAFMKDYNQRREAYDRKIIAIVNRNLAREGYPNLPLDAVEKLMLLKETQKPPLIAKYLKDHFFVKSNEIHRLLKGTGIGRVELKLNDAIDLIHRNEGIASIAHTAYGTYSLLSSLASVIQYPTKRPWNPKIPDEVVAENLPGLLKPYLEMFDGVEVFYPHHGPLTTIALERLCLEEGIIMTCGSDNHGLGRPKNVLGSISMPDEYIREFLQAAENRYKIIH